MPKSILIVDDSKSVRKVTREFIEMNTEFHVCGEAVDGIDALDKAQDLCPDLIILDLAMPHMNGLQTARALRARRATCKVPIILFTLYASELRNEDTVPSGINAVVSKAEDLAVLGAQLNSLLGSTPGGPEGNPLYH